jgi:hypothetical protein
LAESAFPLKKSELRTVPVGIPRFGLIDPLATHQLRQAAPEDWPMGTSYLPQENKTLFKVFAPRLADIRNHLPKGVKDPARVKLYLARIKPFKTEQERQQFMALPYQESLKALQDRLDVVAPLESLSDHQEADPYKKHTYYLATQPGSKVFALKQSQQGYQLAGRPKAQRQNPFAPGTLYEFVYGFQDGSHQFHMIDLAPDLYSRYQPWDVEGPSQVVNPLHYQWQIQGFDPERKQFNGFKPEWVGFRKESISLPQGQPAQKMIPYTMPERARIYQLHIGTFSEDKANPEKGGTFESAIQRLDYLKWMGFNTVWLCPTSEFPGQQSKG